ncbi:hypothetical protein K2173_021177 [Erythroxylum novogranatense]|uniref:Late embryogenesis abundant protein LEA-2 subgroup domain-containing protein n=1 Tax=Erythroxylum novogranatense TaxID=1862640 RepID=A0AAV8TMS8_9ROSI|nr:hypothetical protein K2173_021177 [Erythroxylum novogranatense]
MSSCEKQCGKQCCHSRKELYRRILIVVGAIVVVVLFAIFLVWIILRPTKPQIVLHDNTLYALNLSQPNFVTMNMQITISTRNPNARVGIYFDKFDIYASYRNEQITPATELPRGNYLGHKEINVWSPFLCGNSVPISLYAAAALCEDLNAGIVLVNIKVSGKLKWKVGTWMSGKYHLSANCPVYISCGKHDGVPFELGIKYQSVSSCSVDV